MKKPLAIICSDKHLNVNNMGLIYNINSQIIALCKELNCYDVFNLGDELDSRISQTQKILTFLGNEFKRFGREKINTILISGNHDKTDYFSEESFLDNLEYHPNLKLVRKEYRVPIPHLKYVLWFLPYFDEEELYLDYLKKIISVIKSEKANLSKSLDKHILFTHIGVHGFLTNSKEAVNNKIKIELFKYFDKVFVGHYHDRMEMNNVHYIGSTHCSSFSEDNEKGLVILYNDLTFDYHSTQFKCYFSEEIELRDGLETDKFLNKAKSILKEGFFRYVFKGTRDQFYLYEKFITELKRMGVDVKTVRKDIVVGVEEEKISYSIEEIKESYNVWKKRFKPKNQQIGDLHLSKILNEQKDISVNKK